MIISTEKSSSVFTNTQTETISFKIKAGAKAFKILSSFYSDPILAIPRELGANAWDSHVAAKNPEPFLVHAPNTIEPWFSVRDYGTGLSSDDVINIYTTYFESTKAGSNDYDGCMGLGSKTPFNYTDNFTVTSWFNGKKFVYNCFISENSIPSIMLLASENTAEPNGVEVKLGVKNGDINKFVEAITRAYSTFLNKPKIVGQKIEYPTVEYIYKSNSGRWALRDHNNVYRSGYSTVGAYMGNYRYTVNFSAITAQLTDEDRKKYHHVINAASRCSFDLYFNVGDLDVAPNKEELQYDVNEKTSRAVVELLHQAVGEIDEYIKTQIETPPSLWDAMGLCAKYFSYDSPFRNLANITNVNSVPYNGQQIRRTCITLNELAQAVYTKFAADDALKINYFEDVVVGGGNWKCYPSNRGKIQAVSNKYKHVLFFYTNGGTVQHRKIRHYIKSAKVKDVYYVINDNSKDSRWEKFVKYLGIPSANNINIDTLPKAPKVDREKREVNIGRTIAWTVKKSISGNIYVTRAVTDDLVQSDCAKKYYYLNFSNTSVIFGNKEICTEKTINSILDAALLTKTINDGDIVYAIKRKEKKIIGPNFVDVAELLYKHLNNNLDTHYSYPLYLKKNYHRLLDTEASPAKTIHEYADLLKENCVIKIVSDTTRAKINGFSKRFSELSHQATTIHSAPDENIFNTFDIKSTKTFKEIDDLIDSARSFNEQYLEIFSINPPYSYNLRAKKTRVITKVINFVDEKSS
jgi:hypothetical protein